MKKVVTFGEIMLRLATPGYLRFVQSDQLTATFGGGEANVAVSLANYGIPVEYVTRLPQNEIADWCISELRNIMSVPNRSSAAATCQDLFPGNWCCCTTIKSCIRPGWISDRGD